MLKPDYGSFWKLDLDDDGVLLVTMNRPERKNAQPHGVLRIFAEMCDDLSEDDRVRVVVLTGAGRAFTAGADLSRFVELGTQTSVSSIASGEVYHRIWHRIIDLPQPMIVAINGDCVGAGITLALCGDILLAADHARIGDPHVPLGMVASGGNCMWPAAVSLLRAKEWLLTGELMSAQEAYRIGLVNHIYPVEELMDRAFTLARKFAKQPKEALRWNKRVINRLIADNLNRLHDAGLAYEALSTQSEEHAAVVTKRLEAIRARKAASE